MPKLPSRVDTPSLITADLKAEDAARTDIESHVSPRDGVVSFVALRPGGDDLPSIPPPEIPASGAHLPRAAGHRKAALEALRLRIRALEQRAGKAPRLVALSPGRQPATQETGGEAHVAVAPPAAIRPLSPASAAPVFIPAWTLGDGRLDHRLPEGGLAPTALHEAKPATARDWPAAQAFALQLAARRLAALTKEAREPPLVLWCTGTAFTAEHGRLHAPGLAAFGLDCRSVLVVETARDAERLWAMEEGLRSGAPALVVGTLREAGLTAARRLSLAAAATGVPCLILTSPRAQPAPATETRWRVARAVSAPHPFDRAAPGACRLQLDLERCRGSSSSSLPSSVVEWCDATYRFHLVAGLADRSAAPGVPGSRARKPSLRAG